MATLAVDQGGWRSAGVRIRGAEPRRRHSCVGLPCAGPLACGLRGPHTRWAGLGVLKGRASLTHVCVCRGEGMPPLRWPIRGRSPSSPSRCAPVAACKWPHRRMRGSMGSLCPHGSWAHSSLRDKRDHAGRLLRHQAATLPDELAVAHANVVNSTRGSLYAWIRLHFVGDSPSWYTGSW